MADFTTKVVPLDWDAILQFDIDALLAQQAPQEIDAKLEALYDMLVDARVRPEDPRATPQNMIHLFRVTQIVMENKNLYLLQAEEDIRTLETKVQEQDDEMAGLLAGGDAPYMTELRTLREDNEDLEKRNDALTTHLAEAEELLSAERTTVRELNSQLTTDRARATAAEEIVSRMKAEIKDYQSQLQNRKDRIQMKNLDDDQIRKQLREKNGELARYVAEVDLLSAENARLTAEVEALTQEVEVTVNELERKDREAKETEQVVLHHDMTIDQLNAEKIALRTKLEDLTRQVETAGSQDERFLSELQAEVHHYERAIHECEAASASKDVVIEQLHADMAKMHEELRPSNLSAVHKQLTEKDKEIADLQGKLADAHQDFELLSLDWDKIDQMLQSQSGVDVEALRGQLHSVNKLKDKLEAYRARHRKTLTRIKAADSQLETKESELVALQTRIDKYEASVYGLPDAAREIKTLELRLRAKDKELLARSRQISIVEHQLGELFDENSELRSRLGTDEKSPIDVSKIRGVLSVELERARSLNAELRSEIDRLEEERLQLKASMRLHAIERGERAVALGLTAKDLADVEDYAERLRIKDGSGSLRKTAGANAAEPIAIDTMKLDKLVVELERAQVDAGEARSEIKTLQADVHRLENDKKRLEAAIKEVSLTLVQMRDNYGDRLRDGSSFQFPAVQKLLAQLDKNEKLSKDGNLSGLEAGKNVLLVNKALRDEARTAKAATDQAISELAAVRKQLAQMQSDHDHWKHIAHNPPATTTLDLPANLVMGSQADYTALVEKLAECLEQSRSKDVAIQAGKEALKKYQMSYSLLAGQQRHLYRNFQSLKTDSESQIASLTEQLQQAIIASENAEIRVSGLEQTVHDLSSPADEMKARLVEMQRAHLILKVNEKALTRRYQALESVEGGLRRELNRQQDSFSHLEQTARERITRLEVIKRSKSAEIDKLQSQLADSVPAADHAQLENQLRLYISKTTHLLEKEQHWLEASIRSQSDSEDARALRKRVESLEADLLEARSRANHMQDACQKLAGERDDANALTHICGLQHRVSSLEVQVELLQNRAEIAERKCAAMADGEAEVERRMATLDKIYSEVKKENYKLREADLELRNSYAGGASREDLQRQVRRIAELESQAEQLRQDVATYKDQCALASIQAADLLSLRNADEKEKTILRAAVEELQMEGDDKLLIGKLHQQILELQILDATAARKESQLVEKSLKLESTIVQLEKEIDDRDSVIFHLRMEQKSRTRTLQRSLSDLRTRLAGTVILDKYERACNRFRDIHARKRDLDERLVTLSTEKYALEARLAETTEKTRSLEELVDALKAQDSSAERITAWHRKMSVLQLAELRLQHELVREREAAQSAKRELNESLTRLHALEEDYVHLQSETDAREIKWEQELEAALSAAEQEREQILDGATAMEIKDILPDRSLPIGQQLEHALRQLAERSRIVKVQEAKLSKLEDTVRSVEDELMQSKADFTNLQLKFVEAHAPKSSPEQADSTTHLEPSVAKPDISRQREADAVRVAKASISAMQDQLTAKDALIEKYRTMLTHVRAEMEAHKEDYSAALQERTDQINALNDRELERLRKPHVSSQAGVPSADSKDDTSSAVVELTAMLSAKEVEIGGLQQRIKETTKEAEGGRTEIEYLRAQLDDKQREIDDAVSKLEVTKGELAEALRQAAEPNEEDTALIAKLQKELNFKATQASELTRTIQELRQSMVQTAENAARKNLTRQDGGADIEQVVQGRTKDLSRKIANLEAKLQSATLHAAEENRTLAARHAGEVRDCRAKVEKLAKERDGLKREVASARVASTSRKSSSGNIAPPLATLTQEKWEVEKRLQRRIDSLREKLEAKTKEAADVTKTLTTMRETLHRTEREKTRLQHKVQSMSTQLTSVQKLEGVASTQDNEKTLARAEDLETLRKKIFEMEIELTGYRQRATQPNNELLQARHEARQLQARIVMLEEIKATASDADETSSRASLVMVLENRLRDAVAKFERTEMEKVQSDASLAQAKLDHAQAIEAQQRLTRRLHELEEYVQEIKSAERERERTSSDVEIKISGATFTLGKMRNAALSLADQPVPTLLTIVEHVARICERLRLENESFKKHGSTHTRYMDAVREIKRLKSEIAESEESKRAADQAGRKSAVVEEENAKLRKQVRTHRERQLKVAAKANELEKANAELERELEGLRKAVIGNVANDSTGHAEQLEQRVKELKAELAERDAMVQDLLSPDKSETGRLAAETRKLKNEVEMWRSRSNKLTEELAAMTTRQRRSPSPNLRETEWAAQQKQARDDILALHKKLEAKEKQNEELQEELSAFDPAFFEELSDLKWNYSEAVRVNVQYEEVIRDFSGKLGLDPKAYLASPSDAEDAGGSLDFLVGDLSYTVSYNSL
ncbi:hypothetical protein HDU89_001304 [Geranomyces variabilis]|nr:hypothetical protein HDU89_001304 [Geranomyces variabilis]